MRVTMTKKVADVQVVHLGYKSKMSESPRNSSVKMISGAPKPNHVAPYWLIKSANVAVSVALRRPDRTKMIPRKIRNQ